MLKKLLIIPPILIGVAVLIYMVGDREAPKRKPPVERARAVRVITADPVTLVPRVIGYGGVYPGTVWSAIAQVSGEVIWVHPDLKKGAILAAGTEIARISPADYALALTQAKANIRSAEAQLAELKVAETNTADLLRIEKRSLNLRETDLKRKRDLLKRGTVARTALETAERDTLAQLKVVQGLENTLRLLPTQRTVQREQIAVHQAQAASAELDLARTSITLPFDARIAEVQVEAKQFAQAGGLLVTADGLNVAEVEAQIPISQFRAMVQASGATGRPSGITAQTLRRILRRIGFEATVRLGGNGDAVEWPARFARISDTVDPKTRTIGAIVAVDGAYAKAEPGQRPPLSKGMFVEIEIRTRPTRGRIVVPRAALHGDRLYVIDGDSRLDVRMVKTGLIQGNLAVIEEGIAPGEKVVVSDLIPAVPKMLLSPRIDDDLQARLTAEAAGSEPTR